MKYKMPAFTIIMPNYNKQEFVEIAVNSVLNQTFKNIELIVVDDCSTDNSLKRIKSFKDKRIKLLTLDQNRGVAFCLKYAISFVRSEFFGILDSDDFLEKNAVEEVLEIFEQKSEIGFVYSQYEKIDRNMKFLSPGKCKNMKKNDSNLFDYFSGHFRAFRLSEYKKTVGFDETLTMAEDRDLIYKLEEVTNFYFLSKVLYKYRILDNSLSNDKNKSCVRDIFDVKAKYNAYKRRKKNNFTPNLTKQQMSSELFRGAFNAFKIKDFKLMLKWSLNAFYLYPFNFYAVRRFFEK